jgi:hypothetical protein
MALRDAEWSDFPPGAMEWSERAKARWMRLASAAIAAMRDRPRIEPITWQQGAPLAYAAFACWCVWPRAAPAPVVSRSSTMPHGGV